MSGGSYNYLCYADAEDLAGYGKRDDLRQMGDALARRGYSDAARETHAILLDVLAFEARTDAAIARLRGVWKAVEWHEDGDHGPEHLVRAVAEYRGTTSAGAA